MIFDPVPDLSDFATSTSAMHRRITGRGKRFRIRIPRRGRIRFVLILLFVAGIFKFVVYRHPAPDRVKEPKHAIHNDSTNNTPPPVAASRKKHRKPPSLSANDVAELLKKNAPDFFQTSELFPYSRGQVKAFYTVDTALQHLGKRLFKRYKPKYGACVALEPATGRICALVSYTRDSVPLLGRNLACQSIFPAASIFKTITAASALEDGKYLPSTELKVNGPNHTLYRYQLEKELKQFRTTTLEKAYAYSVNPVFGRIGLFTVGKDRLQGRANTFGFNAAIPFELPVEISHAALSDSLFYIAEIASGFNTVTTLSPLHGALIAAAVCENGTMPAPFCIDSVVDMKTGRRLYATTPKKWRQTMKPHTAGHVRELMQAVARYGTARKSFRYVKKSRRFNSYTYGGKTGSLDKDSLGRVDWFIGFIRHPENARKRIAVGVVTVHGAYWTVHSSFIGAETARHYIRDIQKREEAAAIAEADTTQPKDDS